MLRLFLVAFLVLCVQKAESCICTPPTGNIYHTNICAKPIAIRANVTVRNTTGPNPNIIEWIVYGLDIISVFRNATNVPIPTSVAVRLSSCSTSFETGKQYLIMGQKGGPANNTFETDLCSFSRQWEGIPAAEAAKFNEYGKNCTSA